MTTVNKTQAPNLNTEIATARILDLPMFNRVVYNLLRANANVVIAEKVMMDLMNPELKQNGNQIAQMDLDIKNSLTAAKAVATESLQSMIWVDNTYDGDATQMRRSYEQIRDGVHCINDQLKDGCGLRQATCEFNAGVVNYLMAIGYTDIMAIESAILEFNEKYKGSKI